MSARSVQGKRQQVMHAPAVLLRIYIYICIYKSISFVVCAVFVTYVMSQPSSHVLSSDVICHVLPCLVLLIVIYLMYVAQAISLAFRWCLAVAKGSSLSCTGAGRVWSLFFEPAFPIVAGLVLVLFGCELDSVSFFPPVSDRTPPLKPCAWELPACIAVAPRFEPLTQGLSG